MDNRALYIVRQNYNSVCFKCKKEKKFFTVYRCGKCDPQKVEKYCYECCEASLTSEDKEEEEEDDDKHINALCMGCAFCYDYIHVSRFYKDQKKNGWQGLKYDCDKCTCCCSGPYCLTGSLCCCVSESEESESEEEGEEKKKREEEEREKKKEKRKEAMKKLFEKENNMYYNQRRRRISEEEEEEEKKSKKRKEAIKQLCLENNKKEIKLV